MKPKVALVSCGVKAVKVVGTTRKVCVYAGAFAAIAAVPATFHDIVFAVAITIRIIARNGAIGWVDHNVCIGVVGWMVSLCIGIQTLKTVNPAIPGSL